MNPEHSFLQHHTEDPSQLTKQEKEKKRKGKGLGKMK